MSYGDDQTIFMRLGRQTVNEWNPEQAGRYMAHIEEEAREAKEAWEEGDYVKSVDGAVDAIVVALGFLRSLAIDPDKAWAIVLRANMSKVDGTLGPTVWRQDGQIGKPEGFIPPEAELQKLIAHSMEKIKDA